MLLINPISLLVPFINPLSLLIPFINPISLLAPLLTLYNVSWIKCKNSRIKVYLYKAYKLNLYYFCLLFPNLSVIRLNICFICIILVAPR